MLAPKRPSGHTGKCEIGISREQPQMHRLLKFVGFVDNVLATTPRPAGAEGPWKLTIERAGVGRKQRDQRIIDGPCTKVWKDHTATCDEVNLRGRLIRRQSSIALFDWSCHFKCCRKMTSQILKVEFGKEARHKNQPCRRHLTLYLHEIRWGRGLRWVVL